MKLDSRHAFAACLCAVVTLPATARTVAELSLGGGAQTRENFYYQESGDQTTALGLLIRPELTLQRRGTLLKSHLQVGANAAFYNANPEDNFVDTEANGGLDLGLGINTFSFRLSFKRSHDPFGSNRTEGTDDFNRELDRWQRRNVQLEWVRHGEKRGDIFTNVSSSFGSKRYITNTEETSYLDRSSSILGGLVGIQLTQKTGVFLSARYTKFSFDDDGGILDRSGSTKALFTGLRWSATARTEGNVRFGAASRNNEGFDTRFWEAELEWEPVQTHVIEVSTARRFDPSYRTDTEFFDTRQHQLSWGHYWNRRLTSRVQVTNRQRTFVGSPFKDTSNRYAGKLKYVVDNGLSIYAQLTHASRDAEQSGYTFDANTFTLGFDARLN